MALHSELRAMLKLTPKRGFEPPVPQIVAKGSNGLKNQSGHSVPSVKQSVA